jgi:hypothetical protein
VGTRCLVSEFKRNALYIRILVSVPCCSLSVSSFIRNPFNLFLHPLHLHNVSQLEQVLRPGTQIRSTYYHKKLTTDYPNWLLSIWISFYHINLTIVCVCNLHHNSKGSSARKCIRKSHSYCIVFKMCKTFRYRPVPVAARSKVRMSWAVGTLRLWVRNPLEEWLCVCISLCCAVLCGWRSWKGPIPHPRNPTELSKTFQSFRN